MSDVCNDGLHHLCRSTDSGKLLYAVNAWRSFTSVVDRQRLEALVKRGVRDLCAADIPSSHFLHYVVYMCQKS